MTLTEIQDILFKYAAKENDIENSLHEREAELSEASAKKVSTEEIRPMTLEQVTSRNKQILKDLETAKGSLRSKAIFSPSEMQWEQICKQYKDSPSLPVTTYKCHLPVYV